MQRAEQELAGLRAGRTELGAELWAAYKSSYESYLADEAPAGEETP